MTSAHSVPRTLLLSSSLPGTVGVGGVLLGELCHLIPNDRLFAFVTESYGSKYRRTELEGYLKYQLEEGCDWKLPPSRFGRVGKLLPWGLKRLKNVRECNRLVQQAIAMGSKNNVEQVWSVLESPTTIRITKEIVRKLGVPFKVMVWDDVEHVLPHFQVDRLSRNSVRAEFDWLLRNATSCAVIGESMKEHYDQRYSTIAQIVRHGIQHIPDSAESAVTGGRDAIHIGFAGSVTAKSAFESFIAALDEAQWRINDREVHLHLSGLRFVLGSDTAARIHYHGWLPSVEATVAMLKKCDLLYLPQPFEQHLRIFTQLSFPAKLSTYLASGRPILLHSPKFASLRPVFDKYPFGCWLDTLETSDIIETTTRFVSDDEATSRAIDFSKLALQEVVSYQQMRAAFASFVGEDARAVSGRQIV